VQPTVSSPASPLRSPHIWGLGSATFAEPGYEHIIEVVHQRDADARRHLESLDLALYDPDGALLRQEAVDTREETLDLAALVGDQPAGSRIMVVFDARYDERIFPYRPHHYAYLRRRGGSAPALYYAVSSALGGVPDRIGAQRITHFETYLFLRRPHRERCSVMVGNLSRFAATEAQLTACYAGGERQMQEVALGPKAHAEIPLAAEHQGRRIERVELKAPFRLASYVVGRREPDGELVLFDHLFTYFK
jgi:hypothetical protein